MKNLIREYNNSLSDILAKWTIDYIDKNIITKRIKEYDNHTRLLRSESWYENINFPINIIETNKWKKDFMRAFNRLIRKYKKEYARHITQSYSYFYEFSILDFGGFKTEMNSKKNNRSSYSITGLNNIHIVIRIDYSRL